MNYFPAFIDIANKKVAVVGGGNVAQRKVELLIKFNCEVHLISPQISSGLVKLAEDNPIQLHYAEYQQQLTKDAVLVIAATDNEAVNAQVKADAELTRQLTNVVDQPDLCDYITPAIIDRNPICIALSSGGTSPVLLRVLRSQLESLLPFNLGDIAHFCDANRDTVKASFDSVESRKQFWEVFLQQFSVNAATSEQQLKAIFNQQLSNAHAVERKCYQLDTSTLETDDLNLRAVKRMQAADVLIQQGDIAQPFIEMIRRDAEKITAQDIASNLEMVKEANVIIVLTNGDSDLPEDFNYPLLSLLNK